MLASLWFNLTHIDIWFYRQFYGENYFEMLYTVLIEWWLWVPLLYLFLKHIVLELWVDYRNLQYKKTIKWVLLAIDVPKRNEQSVAAMENVFVQILGAHQTLNFWETYWQGKLQMPISCEIVSIDGYIQLLIRAPIAWRDLIESSIYGQFPDAEITEVEDYVNTVPDKYPNDTHDMWGVEWHYDNKVHFYPLKTYPEFEDRFSEVFVDPMAGLLEAMAKIGKGEQLWMHILCKPLGVDWAKDAEKEINKQLGKPEPVKKSMFGDLFGIPREMFNDFSEQAFNTRPLPHTEAGEKKEDQFGQIWRMSPGQRTNLEALERKVSKLAFDVKIRYGYFAEKGKMNKVRGANAIIGAVKQFNSIGRQGLKPELKKTATKADYFAVKRRIAYRQRMMTALLKKRSTTAGMPKMKMNTEELATIFHFPSMFIKAPMLKHTEVVKSEAPLNLPYEETSPDAGESPRDEAMISGEARLPWEEAPEAPTGETEIYEPTFDYDSDYFEHKFAKDKEAFRESRDERETQLKRIEREEKGKEEISVGSQKEEVEPEIVDATKHPFAKETDRYQVEPEVEKESYDVEVIGFFGGHQAIDESEGDEQENKPENKPEDNKFTEDDDEVPPNLPFV